MVGNDAVIRPGGDAAIVRVRTDAGEPTKKALAMTTDCTPRYCAADPVEGGKQAVAETWRNLVAVGAKPLAITNCLNFGNPTKPEIMGQIVGCLEGMKQACLALDYPIVSGNVSLYNETVIGGNVSAIQPTPAIGGVGLLKDVEKRCGLAFTEPGLHIILIGETRGHLGASLYLREILKREEGPPPPVDLAAERRNGDFVRGLIKKGRLAACHDLSDGGLLVALAEMCMAGNMGCAVTFPGTVPPHAFAFGEDQARYLIACDASQSAAILSEAIAGGVPAMLLGTAGGDTLSVDTFISVAVADLKTAHESFLPNYMNS
jgi:phosphoribosylformylglycinamidine synthase